MATSPLARLRDDRGGINFVKLFMVFGLVAAGYFSFVYVPLYLEYFAMKKAVRTACNVAYGDRRTSAVSKVLFNGFREEKMMDEAIAADGSIIRRPTPFDERNFTITLQQTPPSISIELAYDRQIVMPIFKKPKTVSFSIEHTEDLSEIKY